MTPVARLRGAAVAHGDATVWSGVDLDLKAGEFVGIGVGLHVDIGDMTHRPAPTLETSREPAQIDSARAIAGVRSLRLAIRT